MKKILYILLLLFPNLVLAATCSASDKADLLTLSSVVSVNYVENTGYYTGEEVGYPEGLDEEDYEDYVVEYNYFTINIYNLLEDYYVKVTNNVNDTEIIVEYSDLVDGTYTFEHETLSDVTTYTFEIYASSDTNCEDTHLTTKYLTVPKYNSYSTLAVCDSYPDESVCQKYTTVSTYTESYVFSYLTNENFNSNLDDAVDTDADDSVYINILYLILGGVSIVIIVLIIRVIIKKRSDLK